MMVIVAAPVPQGPRVQLEFKDHKELQAHKELQVLKG
jgi:hypothetical protein